MSTGLSIISASYGSGSSTVDVTSALAAMVKDGILRFTVTSTALNVTDPAPGQLKKLDVTYTINGGSKNQITKKDNELVNIDAPPIRTASGLQITKAEYGYPGNYTDVTDAVQNLVSNGSINLTVGFKAVGIPDPNPSKQKHLKVDYSLNGSSSSDTINDGSPFKLSAPSVTAPSNITPSQNVGSFIGILFKNIAIFFGIFLHALSVFTAVQYGNQFISPLLWGGLAFFIPFFSFTVLPVVTFGMRLFKSSDFIV
jgi:hypothetical protein